jgi:hypothetical protein
MIQRFRGSIVPLDVLKLQQEQEQEQDLFFNFFFFFGGTD